MCWKWYNVLWCLMLYTIYWQKTSSSSGNKMKWIKSAPHCISKTPATCPLSRSTSWWAALLGYRNTLVVIPNHPSFLQVADGHQVTERCCGSPSGGCGGTAPAWCRRPPVPALPHPGVVEVLSDPEALPDPTGPRAPWVRTGAGDRQSCQYNSHPQTADHSWRNRTGVTS